jgi:hypothetical protein
MNVLAVRLSSWMLSFMRRAICDIQLKGMICENVIFTLRWRTH